MGNMRYSFSARFVSMGKEIKGLLEINKQKVSFKTDTKYIVDKEVNWNNAKWKVGSEFATLLFVVKKEKKFLEIKDQDKFAEKFYIDAKDENEIVDALLAVKRVFQEELARQEAERQHQEEVARQEAERRHREEVARQEAERKYQEELARQEAERKHQEELARQEAERQYQEELARQEAERQYQEELARQEAERKHREELARQEAERKCLIERLMWCLSSYADAGEMGLRQFMRIINERKSLLLIQEIERDRQEELSRQEADRIKREKFVRKVQIIQRGIENRENKVQIAIKKALSEKATRVKNEKLWEEYIKCLENKVDDIEEQAHQEECRARKEKDKRQEIQRKQGEILAASIGTKNDKNFRLLASKCNEIEQLIKSEKEKKCHKDRFFFVKEEQANKIIQATKNKRADLENSFLKEMEISKGRVDECKKILEQIPDDLSTYYIIRGCFEKVENIADEYFNYERQLQDELKNLYDVKCTYLEDEKNHYVKLADLESERATCEGRFFEELERFIRDEINRKEEERKRREAERRQREELARQEAEKRRQEMERRRIVEFERFEAAKKAKEAEEKRQREELARQEAERKRQEELARQEAERKRQEELARQEAERKHQEELARREAERKRQEELARQEAERKRKEKQLAQEAERLYIQLQSEDTSVFSSLAYRMSTRAEYSYGYKLIGAQVLEFFDNMYLEDDFVAYIDENMSDYDVLRAKMEYRGISKRLCNEFENLISEVYYEEDLDNSIIAFIEKLCREASGNSDPASSSNEGQYRIKLFDSEEAITNEMRDVRREQREEKRRAYERDYNKILDYIKSKKIPVDKAQIIRALPGVNKNTLRDVLLQESKVLNFYRTYIWYENLTISAQDVNVINGYVEEIVADYDTHHITELYEELSYRYDGFLRRNMINTPHRLFSVVQVMCKDIIASERPYIAQKGVKILNAKERIERYIYNKTNVSIRELLEYANSNYMQIGNILQMLNELNSTHIFKDKRTLISVRDYHLSYTIGRKVENVFFEEVQETGALAICELSGVKKLPDVSMEWNDWLVYSLLLKWGNKLKVTTAGNNFKEAIPLVYIGSIPDEEQLEKIGNRAKGKTLGSALDVSDVDDVLEDVLDDILDDLEF